MSQFMVYVWEIKVLTQKETAKIKNDKSSIRIQGQVPHTSAHFQRVLQEIGPLSIVIKTQSKELSYMSLRNRNSYLLTSFKMSL